MKKIILGFILGVTISGTVGVLASTIISSTNVTYQDKTVNNALDELYDNVKNGKENIADTLTKLNINTEKNASFSILVTNINLLAENKYKEGYAKGISDKPKPYAKTVTKGIDIKKNTTVSTTISSGYSTMVTGITSCYVSRTKDNTIYPQSTFECKTTINGLNVVVQITDHTGWDWTASGDGMYVRLSMTGY